MLIARFLRAHVSLILLASVLLGFVVPGLHLVPPEGLIVFLAAMIFASSFRISRGEVQRISPWQPVLFYVLRYPVLAVVLWLVARGLYPSVATAVFLLTLAPAGVASPGVSGIYRGNVSLSVLLVVISAFLAPFLIPLVLELFVAREIHLDTISIFRTLLVSVFVPLIAHLPFRRYPIAEWFRQNDSIVVVPAIGMLVMIVIGQQKEFFLAYMLEAGIFVVVTAVVYLVYYAFGWYLFRSAPIRDRVSYALGSGVNNTAIVIVLAYLHFSPAVSIFLVVAELAWVGSIVVFKRFLGNEVQQW